jgi:cell division septation protein DedD
MTFVAGRVQRRFWFALVALIALSPTSATAQGSTLQRAEAAMTDGRFEEARTLVADWWRTEEARADRATRQLGIWLRARLQVDPDAATSDYRRLAVEFPGGPYSDQALFRLAQDAERRGAEGELRQFLTQLERDYPASGLRGDAASWLARLPGSPAAGGQATARPAGAQAASATTPPPSAQGGGGFTLQFGAFGQQTSAQELVTRLTPALSGSGVELRIVQLEDSPLHRVRGGGFPSRAAAEAAARELAARGVEVFIAADRDRERPSGRP